MGGRKPSEEWNPAGYLASRVLVRPTSPSQSAPWFPNDAWQKLDPRLSDRDALRSILGAEPSKEDLQWMAAARNMVDVHDSLEAMHERTGEWMECRRVGVHRLGHAGEQWIASPGEVVYLSALAGFARKTLRTCAGCLRLEAFPRVGYDKMFCDKCRSLRRTPQARIQSRGFPEGVSEEKLHRFLKVWDRMYKRVARLVLKESSTAGRRRRRRLPNDAGKAFRVWEVRAKNALLETETLDTWERQFAPRETPGKKRGTRRLSQEAAWRRLRGFLLGDGSDETNDR